MSGNRIKQLNMEKELASSFEHYQNRYFDIHYPASTDQRYARQLGTVLEAERKRLRAWIPLRSNKRIEVHLFPLRQFISSFSSSVAVGATAPSARAIHLPDGAVAWLVLMLPGC